MKREIKFLTASFLTFLLLSPIGVVAQNFQNAVGQAGSAAKISGVETGKGVEDYVATLTSIALSLIGIIFFILMFYGGYKWMLARGDQKEVEVAKDTIFRALIGLIVVILAYALSQFVIERLVGAAAS